jgi:peptidoglycan hydrolase-like protein with peptidoglycan-binding domain
MLFVLIVSMTGAYALDPSTLYNGCKGEEVKKMQQALIDQGYLGGYADGIFGRNTENAVRKFQTKHGLTSDGLAGKKTLAMIYAGSSSGSTSQAAVEQPKQDTSSGTSSSGSSSSGSNLFSGNYATLRIGSTGNRVKTLQKALISLGILSGSADGRFGAKTRAAVEAFQQKSGLEADGLAGKKTLTALEKAASAGQVASAGTSDTAASSSSDIANDIASSLPAGTGKMDGPSASSIQLLHWFNDIKPSLSNGNKLLVYDPSTGLGWTLKVISRGRHCDAEPLTLQDTQIMVKAFGGKNTWDVKKVYVRLPNGVWTVGSTHDMPHESGSIKDNGFDGHLCVHFLRDMDETEKNDPNYGVTNQKAIRALWKSLTGQDIEN